jgi:sarcosine oxidase delta subunit
MRTIIAIGFLQDARNDMTAQLKIRIDLEVVKDIFALITEFRDNSWGLPDESFRHEAVRVLKDIRETLTHAVRVSKELPVSQVQAPTEKFHSRWERKPWEETDVTKQEYRNEEDDDN